MLYECTCIWTDWHVHFTFLSGKLSSLAFLFLISILYFSWFGDGSCGSSHKSLSNRKLVTSLSPNTSYDKTLIPLLWISNEILNFPIFSTGNSTKFFMWSGFIRTLKFIHYRVDIWQDKGKTFFSSWNLKWTIGFRLQISFSALPSGVFFCFLKKVLRFAPGLLI